MSYIVFDLEWNQCPYGKSREVKALPFEIIEIGAVKLDEERRKTDQYHLLVRPSVYRKLHFRTKEIVQISREELAGGASFPEAVQQFLAWSGPDAVFCTWGSVDLAELQRNMKYYGLLNLLKGPMHYLDVQKLFAIQYEDMKSRRALEYAIDFLHLDKTENFHRALADAQYTAEIFQTIDMDVVLAYDSIDVYQNPKTKTEEIFAVYNGYSKYISREFSNKEEAMHDPEVQSTYCCRCGRKARKKIRWFTMNSRSYYTIAACPEHGLVKGRIRMRHTDEGKIYAVKTIKICGEAEAEMIRKKREELKERRRRKKRENADGEKQAKTAENKDKT